MADLLPAPPPKTARRKPISPGLLRRQAAARYLGVGVSTLDRLSAAGLVPQPIRLGGALVWSRHELAEWCRRGCPPQAEWAPIWADLLRRRAAVKH
jgi:predicted DNA-binding transcriptional regulator AlpA